MKNSARSKNAGQDFCASSPSSPRYPQRQQQQAKEANEVTSSTVKTPEESSSPEADPFSQPPPFPLLRARSSSSSVKRTFMAWVDAGEEWARRNVRPRLFFGGGPRTTTTTTTTTAPTAVAGAAKTTTCTGQDNRDTHKGNLMASARKSDDGQPYSSKQSVETEPVGEYDLVGLPQLKDVTSMQYESFGFTSASTPSLLIEDFKSGTYLSETTAPSASPMPDSINNKGDTESPSSMGAPFQSSLVLPPMETTSREQENNAFDLAKEEEDLNAINIETGFPFLRPFADLPWENESKSTQTATATTQAAAAPTLVTPARVKATTDDRIRRSVRFRPNKTTKPSTRSNFRPTLHPPSTGVRFHPSTATGSSTKKSPPRKTTPSLRSKKPAATKSKDKQSATIVPVPAAAKRKPSVSTTTDAKDVMVLTGSTTGQTVILDDPWHMGFMRSVVSQHPVSSAHLYMTPWMQKALCKLGLSMEDVEKLSVHQAIARLEKEPVLAPLVAFLETGGTTTRNHPDPGREEVRFREKKDDPWIAQQRALYDSLVQNENMKKLPLYQRLEASFRFKLLELAGVNLEVQTGRNDDKKSS